MTTFRSSLVFAAVVMASACCFAQTYPTSVSAKILHCPFNEVIEKTATGEACVVPAPLKCGKYQHVSHDCDNLVRGDIFACTDIVGHCADDLHTVTEKEWQELMARLKKLEAR